MARILVCGGEAGLRETLCAHAQYEGHEAAEAAGIFEAVVACKKNIYDIFIVDIDASETDGFYFLKEIRKLTGAPMYVLSHRGGEHDKTAGFEAGADDYLVKPFSYRELMLRIAAMLRRMKTGDEAGRAVYVKDGLTADMAARTLSIDGAQVHLSPKSYALLFYLIRNRNIAAPREKILTDVWGYDYYGDERTLDTHIKLLRRALGPYAGRVVTLRGLGYCFEG